MEKAGEKYTEDENEDTDNEDGAKADSKDDENDHTAIYVGLSIAVVLGALTFGFLKFRN